MLVKSKVKYIQTLGQKKSRDESGLFIAEGNKLILEILRSAPDSIVEIFALESWIKTHEETYPNVRMIPIEYFELEKISQLTTPNEVLAVVRQFATDEKITTKDQLILVLDSIRDPGNLGTIIRIADWFGIKQIVCSEDSVEVYNPKVVQATMGSITRVRVYYRELTSWLGSLKDSRIYAATLDGRDVSKLGKLKEGILVIGNESGGISEAVLKLANVMITIPGKGNAESLNAAVACGIILSHIV